MNTIRCTDINEHTSKEIRNVRIAIEILRIKNEKKAPGESARNLRAA